MKRIQLQSEEPVRW